MRFPWLEAVALRAPIAALRTPLLYENGIMATDSRTLIIISGLEGEYPHIDGELCAKTYAVRATPTNRVGTIGMAELRAFSARTCLACRDSGMEDCRSCEGNGRRRCDVCEYDHECACCSGTGYYGVCRECLGAATGNVDGCRPCLVGGVTVDRERFCMLPVELAGAAFVRATPAPCERAMVRLTGCSAIAGAVRTWDVWLMGLMTPAPDAPRLPVVEV